VANPIAAFVDSHGVMILDGGLATTLEACGADLRHELWSARMLMDDPGQILQVHRDFLEAGADCIVSASYQASFEGLGRFGLDDAEVERVLRLSVELALEARDAHLAVRGAPITRAGPFVAAGIGPYGAVLADGSEYVGDYGLTERELYDFHRRRWRILAATDADLIACETIPSLLEVRALIRLIAETPGVHAWISCACSDERSIADGTPIRRVAQVCHESPGVAAIGINCTAPQLVSPLIAEVRSETDKPVLVYPNSGEAYDAASKGWHPNSLPTDWGEAAGIWADAGASAIGGCCRTGPAEVRAIRNRVLSRGRV